MIPSSPVVLCIKDVDVGTLGSGSRSMSANRTVTLQEVNRLAIACKFVSPEVVLSQEVSTLSA